MADQEPPTEPMAGLPDGQRTTVPLRRRWTGSAPVPAPRPRRRVFRLPRASAQTDDTRHEPTLNMPADELAALLRGPAPHPQLPAPPGWGPAGWAPPAGWKVGRRRRRRWPWVLLTVGLLSVACCCGVPALIAKPFIDEYPAKVSAPARAAGLVRVDDAAARRLTADLKRRVRSEYLLAEEVFAAVYTEPKTDGEDVTLLGAGRLVLDPGKDLRSALGKLSRLTVSQPRSMDAGRLGGELRCGQATGHDSTVVCGWADHGSIGVAVFTRRSTEDSAALLRGLRAAVVSRS